MTLTDYCKLLGWSGRELGRQAGINPHTALKALNGETVAHEVARKIAEAISRAMGKTVLPGEIGGLNY